MDRPAEIDLLCRLCLVKDRVDIPIFEEQGDIRQIFLKISCCLPISISLEDSLPKKICDNCSIKLDSLYDFWNCTVNAEKTLLTWLGQAGVKDAGNTITAVAQQIAKPESQIVKVEDIPDLIDGGVVEDDEEEERPQKRARRSAAVKAQETIANVVGNEEDDEEPSAKKARSSVDVDDSDEDEASMKDNDDDDDDEGEDFEGIEPKMEDEGDESEGEVKPTFDAIPGTSAQDQPGPSGVGKIEADAPLPFRPKQFRILLKLPDSKHTKPKLPKPRIKSEAVKFNSISNYCPYCQKYYTSEKIFAYHKYLHKIQSETALQKVDEANKIFKCTFCEAQCTSKEKLATHLTSHEEICKRCGLTFANPFILGIHLSEHDPDEKICCTYCPYKGSLTHCLKTHLLTKHFKVKISRCNICGANYSSKVHLEEHIRFHHDKMDPHECIVCQRTFIFRSSLNKHQINSHRPLIDGDVPSNYCIVCKRTLSTVEALQKHITEKHLKAEKKTDAVKERFICDICGKDFSHRQSWLLHTKGHSGLKPYKCKSCSKTFRVRAFLTQHEKSHSDERPFACELCGMCFKRKEGLRRHLKVHSDVKPFVCPNCDKGFRRREHLKLHLNSCNRTYVLI